MDFETIKRFITTGLSQKNGMVVGAAIAVAVIRVFSR